MWANRAPLPVIFYVVSGCVAAFFVIDYVLNNPPGSGQDLLELLAFAGASASLPVACRYPVTAAAIFMVFAGAFALWDDQIGFITLVAFILTAVIGAVSRIPVTGYIVIALLLWSAVISLAQHGDLFYLATFALFCLPAAFVGVAFGGLRRRIVHTEQANRELAENSERVRVRERESLARDLHDIVAHQLTIISLVSGSKRRSTDAEKLRESAAEVHDLSNEALRDLRKLVSILREPGTDTAVQGVPERSLLDMELYDGLEYLKGRFSALGFGVESLIDIDPDVRLSRATVSSALRILQECCTNVAKYAVPGSEVTIELSSTQEWLTFTVDSTMKEQPRGARRTSPLSSGQGVLGIVERASLLRGYAAAEPVGGRWSVWVMLPVG